MLHQAVPIMMKTGEEEEEGADEPLEEVTQARHDEEYDYAL